MPCDLRAFQKAAGTKRPSSSQPAHLGLVSEGDFNNGRRVFFWIPLTPKLDADFSLKPPKVGCPRKKKKKKKEKTEKKKNGKNKNRCCIPLELHAMDFGACLEAIWKVLFIQIRLLRAQSGAPPRNLWGVVPWSWRLEGETKRKTTDSNLFVLYHVYSSPDRKGLLDFMLESAFAMLLHHDPRPIIPPELLASGSRRVPRQSCSPVDPAEYPARAARQWIPPSILPEQPASGSCRVSLPSTPIPCRAE